MRDSLPLVIQTSPVRLVHPIVRPFVASNSLLAQWAVQYGFRLKVRSGEVLMSIAEAAKQVYEEDLRSRLEREHKDHFVAIEPNSRRYFLGKTFLEAALAAKQAYPERKSFVLRVGHEAAFHIGGFSA